MESVECFYNLICSLCALLLGVANLTFVLAIVAVIIIIIVIVAVVVPAELLLFCFQLT